ncbi:hypothetical protein VKT23_020781 [Stygiomarasmius scandens]|uniref:Uncharacterized protein n=1 Tax=Marasmiellus scandens TaxID=2682957 RepID=A0ABR1JGZ2_9AGAR
MSYVRDPSLCSTSNVQLCNRASFLLDGSDSQLWASSSRMRISLSLSSWDAFSALPSSLTTRPPKRECAHERWLVNFLQHLVHMPVKTPPSLSSPSETYSSFHSSPSKRNSYIRQCLRCFANRGHPSSNLVNASVFSFFPSYLLRKFLFPFRQLLCNYCHEPTRTSTRHFHNASSNARILLSPLRSFNTP